MRNQPKLTKLLNQKLLPPKHSGEVIQKGFCWYIQMPNLTVFVGNSSEAAAQYIKDLQIKPEHALMQLVMDSVEHLNDSPTMLKNV